MPFEPLPLSAAEHAWQVPVQLVLQQNPSTQKLLAQYALPEHADPLANLLMQLLGPELPSQNFVVWHVSSEDPAVTFEH